VFWNRRSKKPPRAGGLAACTPGSAFEFTTAHAVDDRDSTTHPRGDRDGTIRAVHPAGAALHASFAIRNDGLPIGEREDPMGTHLEASAAAMAARRVQDE